MGVDLSDYVEVAERIEKFYARFPEGSLRCKEIRTEEVGDATFLVYVAQAWRTPIDEAPGEGAAWEPVPGKTPYTRDSELMNAETSAWGRAIAALGFEVHRGIASANEVRNRRHNDGDSESTVPISAKQRSFLERLLKEHKLDQQDHLLILDWASQTLTGGRGGTASKAIDAAKSGDTDRLLTAARQWQDEQSELPADTRDLPDSDGRDEGTTL